MEVVYNEKDDKIPIFTKIVIILGIISLAVLIAL